MIACDGRITRNFRLKELANNLAKEDVKLVLSADVVRHAFMMQELRDWAASSFPAYFAKDGLKVSSWYRTRTFNKSCGGDINSAHLDGRATDISNIPKVLYDEFTTAWQVICSKYDVIGGVELADDYLHFDSHSDKFGHKSFRLVEKRRK